MKIIKFKWEDMKGIKSMGEFYERLGIMKELEENKMSVYDVFMNRKECEKIQEVVKKSWKGKYGTSIAMDWLNYSPTTNDEVGDGELWVKEAVDHLYDVTHPLQYLE